MPLQGMLFDLDGTLADTLPVCIQAFQATIERFTGRIPAENELYALFGPNEEGMLERLLPGRLAETLPFFLAAYERFHNQCRELFPGVEDVLSLLQAQQMRMAIVTGKGVHSAAISARILGLNRWVSVIETGFAGGANKPLSIQHVLAGWGMQPAQAAYVGDTLDDMDAARAAGLLPLGAAWAQTSILRHELSPHAHTIFRDVDSFLNWIERC